MSDLIPVGIFLVATLLSIHVSAKMVQGAVAYEVKRGLITKQVEAVELPNQQRDIVLIVPKGDHLNPNDPFSNVTELHFNGDWSGVKLCRGTTCVPYESIFKN